jgi:hypothetical protein
MKTIIPPFHHQKKPHKNASQRCLKGRAIQAEIGGDTRTVVRPQKRGQEPIANWPEGCSALLVPDPFFEALEMVLSGEFEKMDLVSAGYSTLANICFIFLPTYPADFADIPQPFGISGDDGGKRCKLREICAQR